jgi:hypothetical protein
MNNSMIYKSYSKPRDKNMDSKTNQSYVYRESSSFFSPSKRTAYNTPIKGKR